MDIGVDMIELDVQLSSDNELVVIHDFELERTTTGSGTVRAHSLPSLRQLDIGGWFGPQFRGESILTLAEVLDLVGDQVDLNVEVKPTAGDEELIATELVQLLRRRGKINSTIISCFDFDVLRIIRQRDPEVQIGLLTHDPDFSRLWAVARELRARSVHPYWALVSDELIAAARAEELLVVTWTVNDIEVMEALIERGVDGIISDHPERFARVGLSRS